MRVARFLTAFLKRLLIFSLLTLPGAPSFADLRVPTWYDPDGVSVGQDWHYRVPINVPAGATVNSTIKVDVDFAALLAQMGVSGTFDVNSPRVIRSTGALSTTQEFTDSVYAGATDTVGNSRGEVRFLLEDAGATTYYLYFDVTQNGSKSTNPQTPINGNFERGAAGTSQPTGWNAPTKVSANYDAQVRPSESVSVTAQPATVSDGSATRTTDGTPNTGQYSYLIGWRTSTAALTANVPGVTFTRTITVPASSPGNLTFRWKPEGWDSQNFDYLTVSIIGSTTTQILGPASTYTSTPFSPNIGGSQSSATVAGYRQYNGFDCDTSLVHHNGMAVACHSEPWFTSTTSLAAFAGQTVTLQFTASQDNADQSWYLLDDIEWSVVNATLGTPQAWGINITAPAVGTNYVAGQIIPLTVQVDAKPTGATTPMTVNLYDNIGTLQVSGVILYNDGTHGDATSGDAIWSNSTGLVMPLSATTSAGWIIRAYGLDATTTTITGQTPATLNGLAHIPTLANPMTQTNYYNIDEITVNVSTANLTAVKTSTITSDPINGSASPKAIPGATVHYCILITNAGPQTATNIIQTDALPATVTYVASTLKIGTTCATATTAGGSIAGSTITANVGTLTSGATYALVFDATIN